MEQKKYFWKAYYNDGTTLSENDPTSVYKDIDRDKTSGFALEGQGNWVGINVSDGAISINGEIFKVFFNGLSLMDPSLGPYKEFAQFKEAEASIDSLGQQTNEIKTYNIGWSHKLCLDDYVLDISMIVTLTPEGKVIPSINILPNKSLGGILEIFQGNYYGIFDMHIAGRAS